MTRINCKYLKYQQSLRIPSTQLGSVFYHKISKVSVHIHLSTGWYDHWLHTIYYCLYSDFIQQNIVCSIFSNSTENMMCVYAYVIFPGPSAGLTTISLVIDTEYSWGYVAVTVSSIVTEISILLSKISQSWGLLTSVIKIYILTSAWFSNH